LSPFGFEGRLLFAGSKDGSLYRHQSALAHLPQPVNNLSIGNLSIGNEPLVRVGGNGGEFAKQGKRRM
jgi:hypothetical protein